MNTTAAFSIRATLPLALLLALSALGGIFLPSTYLRETPSWAAQGIGQDWVNLLLVCPLLVFLRSAALRGSRRALLVLGGTLIYLVYSFILYAFAMHFNSLFLVYCAMLGLSFFSLVSLAGYLATQDRLQWFSEETPVKGAGIFLIAQALLFAFLWLAEVIPAILTGTPPASLAEVGLITNPVHILDLSIILPAILLSGLWLLKNKARGYFLASLMLSFGVLMSLAIAGMIISMRVRGIPTQPVVGVFMGLVALMDAVLLFRLLRKASWLSLYR